MKSHLYITTVINQLKSLEPLKIADVKNWLEQNMDLYNESKKISEYCPLVFYHCQKEEKNKHHLFQDMYCGLKKHVENLEINLIREKRIKTELEKYELCKHDTLALKEWLKSNVEDGLQIYLEFDINTKTEVIEELEFTICKTSNKNFSFKVDNESSFYSLKIFSDIFTKLFFEKIILPEEYEKWKKE